MEYRDKLVPLYAKHGVAQIRKQRELLEKEFGKSLEELAADWDFPPAQAFVEELQQMIDDAQGLRTPDAKRQVYESLDLLLNFAMFDESAKATRDLKLETLKALL